MNGTNMMSLASADTTTDPHLRPEEWHSQLRFLFDYWLSIAPPDRLPGRQHFQPAAIASVLPFLWLLDVQHEPFRMRYRLAGTAISEAHRREVAGCWFDEVHPELAARADFVGRYQAVVSTGRPSWRRGSPYMDVQHKVVENLVLPMARDGETVDMLLCISRFRDPLPVEPPPGSSRLGRQYAAVDV